MSRFCRSQVWEQGVSAVLCLESHKGKIEVFAALCFFLDTLNESTSKLRLLAEFRLLFLLGLPARNQTLLYEVTRVFFMLPLWLSLAMVGPVPSHLEFLRLLFTPYLSHFSRGVLCFQGSFD